MQCFVCWKYIEYTKWVYGIYSKYTPRVYSVYSKYTTWVQDQCLISLQLKWECIMLCVYHMCAWCESHLWTWWLYDWCKRWEYYHSVWCMYYLNVVTVPLECVVSISPEYAMVTLLEWVMYQMYELCMSNISDWLDSLVKILQYKEIWLGISLKSAIIFI